MTLTDIIGDFDQLSRFYHFSYSLYMYIKL